MYEIGWPNRTRAVAMSPARRPCAAQRCPDGAAHRRRHSLTERLVLSDGLGPTLAGKRYTQTCFEVRPALTAYCRRLRRRSLLICSWLVHGLVGSRAAMDIRVANLLATIPNWFEKGMVAPSDCCSPRADGEIQEDFYLRRGRFAAPAKHFVVHDRVRADSQNAHWRMQVLWPIDLPFLMLHVDPDYQYVLFGEHDRSLGRIYARRPVIAEDRYQSLLARFAALGYDASRVRKVVQLPEQIGMPGFGSDDSHR